MKNRYWTIIVALILTSCNLTALEPTITPAPRDLSFGRIPDALRLRE